MIDTYNYDIKYIEDNIVRRYNHPNNDYSDFDSLLSMRRRMKRFLGCDYPSIHPVQGKDRQELWNAMCDIGRKGLYDDLVTTLFLCINEKRYMYPHHSMAQT